jgi:hypothetical protein
MPKDFKTMKKGSGKLKQPRRGKENHAHQMERLSKRLVAEKSSFGSPDAGHPSPGSLYRRVIE